MHLIQSYKIISKQYTMPQWPFYAKSRSIFHDLSLCFRSISWQRRCCNITCNKRLFIIQCLCYNLKLLQITSSSEIKRINVLSTFFWRIWRVYFWVKLGLFQALNVLRTAKALLWTYLRFHRATISALQLRLTRFRHMQRPLVFHFHLPKSIRTVLTLDL